MAQFKMLSAVFLDQQTFDNNIVLDEIAEQVGKLTCYQTTTAEQIIERSQGAEIIITNKVMLSADVLSQLPNLKLICITATGYNNVDIEQAKNLGIAVCNVSGYAKQSVAQYVFAQLLEYFNQTSHHNQNTEQGLWPQSATFCHLGNTINELAGKSIGIIGYGALGQAVAKIATAFEMQVLIAERQGAKEIRHGRMAFEQVICQADILSFHCPQTKDTEALINQSLLKKMKTSAVLINTARGALVDNQALLNALQTNEIGYAILDVLEQEPPPADHILLNAKLANLKITAHIAWASIEAQQRLISLVAENIASFNNDDRINRIV